MPRIKTTTPADGRQARKAQPVTHRQTAQAAYQPAVGAASNLAVTDAHAEIWDIEPSRLAEIRTLLGIPAKGFLSLTLEEKTQMVAIAREHAWMKTDSFQQTQGGLVNALPGAPAHTPQPPYQLTTGTTLMHHTIASPSSASAPQPSNSSGSIHDISTEFWNIDASKLNELRCQVGVPSKEIPSLTIEEKTKMFNIARARGWLKNPQGGPMNPAAGPSNHAVPRSPRQLHTTQTQSRSMARGSTSSDDEGPSTDTSMPVYKGMRLFPTGAEPPPPPMAPMIHTYSQQQQLAAQRHATANGGMPRPMAVSLMGAFSARSMPHMVGTPQMMQMSPHVHSGGPHAMSPALVNQHPPGANMNMAQFQYRQTMQAARKPGAMPNIMPGRQGSPVSSDGQFGNNDASGSRPGTDQFVPYMLGQMPPGMQAHMQSSMQGQTPPSIGSPGLMQQTKPGGMMPPPSSAMKNNATQNRDGTEPATDSSSRNAAANAGPGPQGQPPAPDGMPHMGNTAPPTPGSVATHTPGPSNLTAPSLPTMNGGPQGPPQLSQGDQLGDNPFNPDLFTGLGFGEDLSDFVNFDSFSSNFDLGGPTSWS